VHTSNIGAESAAGATRLCLFPMLMIC